MKTYCNARLSLLSPAHAMDQSQRSELIHRWLTRHADDEVVKNSRRGRMGVNDGASLSVAFTVDPAQAIRLTRLLDGRKHTLSSLVRHIFEESQS